MRSLPAKTPELLQDLYNEVYRVVQLRLPHTSLSMISVFLEATLREILKKKKGTYPTGANFVRCVSICKKDEIISEKEAEWLKKVNDLVRNSYLHHDVEKMARNIKLKELHAPSKKDFDRLVAAELFAEVDKFAREMIEKHL